ERGFEVTHSSNLNSEQRGNNLSVRLPDERDARGLDLGTQFGEVLDDAVMNQRELAVVSEMRVRVFIGGTPVGRPPSVADSRALGGQRAGFEELLQTRKLPRTLPHTEISCFIDHRNTGGVVSTVFKASQAAQQGI